VALASPLAPISEVASKMATQAGASFSAGLGASSGSRFVDEVRRPKVRRIRPAGTFRAPSDQRPGTTRSPSAANLMGDRGPGCRIHARPQRGDPSRCRSRAHLAGAAGPEVRGSAVHYVQRLTSRPLRRWAETSLTTSGGACWPSNSVFRKCVPNSADLTPGSQTCLRLPEPI
jgi:hypothetical protein